MALVNFERLERMHELICRRATGTPDDFAEKLSISKSMLMINLGQLKQRGGPIKYDSLTQTYYYTKPCRFIFGYQLESEAQYKFKGGQGIFEEFSHSNLIRMGFDKFVVHSF